MIDEMDFERIGSAYRSGKPAGGIAISSADDVLKISRNWRQYYHGLEGVEPCPKA